MTVYSDNFNRDENPLASPWTRQANGTEANTKCESSSGATVCTVIDGSKDSHYAYAQSIGSDQASTVKYDSTTACGVGPLCRIQGSGTGLRWYLGYSAAPAANALNIYYWDGWQHRNVSGKSKTVPPAAELKLITTGSGGTAAQSLYLNGTLELSGTDQNVAAAGYAGGRVGYTQYKVDEWSATDEGLSSPASFKAFTPYDEVIF